MEACVSPAHRRQLPEKWEASPVARQRLGRGAVTNLKHSISHRISQFICRKFMPSDLEYWL